MPLFSSPYDFVFLQSSLPHLDNEQGVVVVRHSVEHPDAGEESAYATRGLLGTSGFVLVPHESGEDAVEVTCVQSFRLGAWTPDSIVAGLAQQQCMVVASLQDLVKGESLLRSSITLTLTLSLI